MRLLAGAACALLLLAPAASGAVAQATVFEGTGTFITFEIGRSFPSCIPHPNLLEPLPGDLRIVLVQAAGAWVLSFTFTHVEAGNALRTCVVDEQCRLAGDPTLGPADATCAKDVLPVGRISLLRQPDGTYAFQAFLGFSLPIPGGGADLTRGSVVPTGGIGLP